MTAPIPGPAGWPLIGNLLDVQGEIPIVTIEALTDVYGPIIKLTLGGVDRYFVGGFDVFDELCDETRFYKLPPAALVDGEKRTKGLFTSPSEKTPDWLQAHRILMPAFGPVAIQGMFDEMHDIASQMVLKWARMGSDQTVLLTEDFTRLTLDTIALCAMDYRFNSFYSDTVHPYVEAMTHSLLARSQQRQIGERLKLLLSPSYAAQLKADDIYMHKVGTELVQHRRDHPTDKEDLLNAMIYGKDPKTGASMRDELIAANMQTFLVAGHETTSGLLSFAFMYMLLNPSTFFAAQEEVDRVVGKGRIQPQHLNDLPYLNAVLRETLRLSPTAPGFTRGIRPENREEHVTVGKGKYEIPRESGILCLLGKIQRDKKVYGEDADEFRPERMLEENFKKLPKNAWKPFGTGLRACIGRAFAWQEALMVTALVLQNFNMTLHDPGYKMKIQQTLTIKPKDTYVHVRLRAGISATQLLERLSGAAGASSPLQPSAGLPEKPSPDGEKSAPTLTILYGGNTGTCQSLAQSLAMQASSQGHTAAMADLDSAVENTPTDHPIIIITASYEGQPPDNAARFVAWLENSDRKSNKGFKGVRYAVFGCGHKDWPTTYQRIPTLVDTLLTENGARRLVSRGESDASQRDIFGDFAKWTDGELWPAMLEVGCVRSTNDTNGNTIDATKLPEMEVEISSEMRAAHLKQPLSWATVIDCKTLADGADGPEKRHMEFQLPDNMTYRTGDYLVILPCNDGLDVRRVIRRFNLLWDAMVTIKKSGGGMAATTTLPTDVAMPAADLLKGYVELSLPATMKDLEILLSVATDPAEKNRLVELLSPPVFAVRIRDQRTSLLDLLEQNPKLPLPLGSFLAMLPPMRTRHYSIASSPLAHADTKCAICYSVISEPTCWSTTARQFHGVASHYLSRLRIGDKVLVDVRQTNRFFRLPADPEKTPLVMFCAGAGLAPFMGFLEERAVQMQQGKRNLAPALLFIGCRDPDTDRIYSERLDAWVESGVVDVRYAFSRRPDDPRAAGCRYVQDRLLHDREDVLKLWEAGAKVYTCGGGKVAAALRAAARQLIVEQAQTRGEVKTEDEAEAWLQERHNERFVTDVFT